MKIGTIPILQGLLLLMGSLDAAVMSIDFGTEWVKIGLVKPSVPFDIVLNRDSKRKTQSVVTIRGTERTYSVNGQALGMRFPKDSFSDLKLLLGQPFDSETSQQYRKTHWTRSTKDEERNSTLFATDNGTKHSVEELVAMLFSYARKEAETTAGEKIKDTVITVPPFFNQYERQAVLDAAAIAELNVLTLVNDGSAVALNYAMTRKFTSDNQHFIIYDIGSGNTAATLVNIKEVTAKEGKWRRNVTFTQVEVLGTGFDRSLGGQLFDQRLQNLLIDRFLKKHPKLTNIRENPRALGKLLKESIRIKQILSANTEAYSSIEALFEDADLKTSVSRADFEEASKDLFSRALQPIKDALAAGKKSIDDIEAVILSGGGVRVPRIQASLKSFVGEKKISQSVNGDESAAIGATFRGASVSSQFKVKDIRLKEITPFPLEAIFAKPEKDSQARRVPLFGANGPLVENKYLPVKHTDDFELQLQYPDSLNSIKQTYGCNGIGEVKITGVKSSLAKYQDRLVEEPKLRVLVSMSTSGVISISKAQAVLQLKPEEKEPIKSKSINNTEEKENKANETDDKEKKANETESKKPEPKKQVSEKVELELSYKDICFPPMNSVHQEKAIQRLRILNDLDKERYARDEARNKLESFIYSVDDLVESSEIQEVSTSEEREKLAEASAEASDWLMLESEEATKKELDQKLKALEKFFKPIEKRQIELAKRPEAIESLKTSFSDIETYISIMTQNLTESQQTIVNPTIEEIRKGAKNIETWLQISLKSQDELKPYQNPVLLVKDIDYKHKELDELKFKLVTKIISLPPPPKPKKAKKTKSDNETQAEDQAEREDEQTKPDQGEEDQTEKESKPVQDNDEKDEL